MKRLLFTAFLGLLLPASGLALELQSVLERTMVSPPASVQFREERYNRMFAESVWLTGYLEYLEDGQLRKVIQTPFEQSFYVRRDRIEIERRGEIEVLPIKQSRSLKTILSGIEAILAGDIKRLEKAFRYELTGTEEDWLLQLTPRSKRIARQLHGLTVKGNEDDVTSIRFELPGGEWHMMEIQNPSVEQ